MGWVKYTGRLDKGKRSTERDINKNNWDIIVGDVYSDVIRHQSSRSPWCLKCTHQVGNYSKMMCLTSEDSDQTGNSCAQSDQPLLVHIKNANGVVYHLRELLWLSREVKHIDITNADTKKHGSNYLKLRYSVTNKLNKNKRNIFIRLKSLYCRLIRRTAKKGGEAVTVNVLKFGTRVKLFI